MKSSLLVVLATHKPCFIPKHKYLLPVHCGRAVTALSSRDSKWMTAHTIGDNTGDNISTLNPYFCELTALYWVWKNYQIIGDPDKIGLCHYRRFFLDIPQNADVIAPVHIIRTSVLKQFQAYHNTHLLKQAIDNIQNKDLKQSIEIYLNQNRGYFFNMFVMKKFYFFKYCEFIFPILFQIMNLSEWEKLDNYQKRIAGFIAERLTGGFIFYLKNVEKVNFYETLPVIPFIKSDKMFKYQLNLQRKLYCNFPNFLYLNSLILSIYSHINRGIRHLNL